MLLVEAQYAVDDLGQIALELFSGNQVNKMADRLDDNVSQLLIARFYPNVKEDLERRVDLRREVVFLDALIDCFLFVGAIE